MNPHRVDAGTLELGAGLETLVRAALQNVAPGGELEVVTASRAVAFELAGWARVAGHEHAGDGSDGRSAFVVRIRRGGHADVLAPALPGRSPPPAPLDLDGLRRIEPAPDHAPESSGLAPLGSLAEDGR